VDLYQLHKPDPLVPIGETLAALSDLVRKGSVRAIGCSQFSADQMTEAAAVAAELELPMFSSVQNEYSLLRGADQAEVLRTCVRLGIAYLPFFPLAGGLLSGKYRRGAPMPEGSRLTEQLQRYPMFDPARFLDMLDALAAFAAQRGRTMLELAMGWLLSQPGVGCLLQGASRVEQVTANVAAATAWRLDEAEMDEVARLVQPESGFGDANATRRSDDDAGH
jgi:aryl-alcohol dehydrogenase-like predicted oxidoreductase